MTKFFIEDTEINLEPRTLLALTFQYFDIITMTETQTSFSNTFTVANTNSNIKYFGNIDQLTTESELPYDFLNSHVEINGYRIYGKSSIERYNEEGIEITFYGEVVDIFDLVNNININEIDFSEYNHTWDFNTVVSSRGNDEGYIYPLIDWSNEALAFTGLTEVTPEYLIPCFYVKTVIEKLFAQIGYSFSGDIFDSVYYKNTLLSLQAKITESIIWKIRNTKLSYNSTNLLTYYEESVVNENLPILYAYLPLDVKIYDYYNLATIETAPIPPLTEINFYKFSAIFDGSYTFNATAVFNWDLFSQITQVKLVLVKSDSTVLNEVTVLRDDYPIGGIVEIVNNHEVSLDEGEFVVPLFKIYKNLTINVAGSNIVYDAKSKVTSFNFDCVGFTPDNDFVNYGKEIYIKSNLPDIEAGELLKTIKYLFGQIITVDPYSKNVHFSSLDEIKSNQSIDWSNKFDSVVSIEFHPDLAKRNKFRYDNEDSMSSEFGSGEILIDDDTLPRRMDIAQVPFSASESYNLTDTKIARIKTYELVESVIERTTDFKDRILLLNKISGYTSIKYDDGVVSSVTTNTNIPYSYFSNKTDADFDSSILDSAKLYNGLDFQNVIETKYTIYQDIFNKMKSVTCLMKLSEDDVINRDFLTPIYLKQLSNKFYVNYIREYTGSDSLVEVELIRL